MSIHQASGNNIRNAVSAVRKHFGWKYQGTRQVSRADHGDGLYRVLLENGHHVEVTVIPRSTSKYEGSM